MLKNLFVALVVIGAYMAFNWGVEYGQQQVEVPLCKEPHPAPALPEKPRNLGTALV